MQIIRYLDPDGHVKHGARRPDGSTREIAGDIYGEHKVTDRPAKVAKLLAPVAATNVLCIGLNYRRHAAEGKAPLPEFPVLFMKATTAVQNPGDPILLPRHLRSDEVDYECELVVVIGRTGKNIPRDRALEHVLGYTCGNDVSARDWQRNGGGGQWCRGKTFDTFAPIGPCLVTPEDIPDPNALAIKCRIGDEVLQDWNTNDMIFDVPRLIEFLSGSQTLVPGTLIFTGTPHGVGFARKPPRWLKAGESVTVEIEKIGALTNPVVEEK
jgi:2-keto-4-pentenoate hydratase/2-oxohepta-3-ene-1,7-dioic acid hydratase in catechol pathway